jgi:hypothetical protein
MFVMSQELQTDPLQPGRLQSGSNAHFGRNRSAGAEPFVSPLISLCSGVPAFHSATFRSPTFRHTEISIPVLNAALRYCY